MCVLDARIDHRNDRLGGPGEVSPSFHRVDIRIGRAPGLAGVVLTPERIEIGVVGSSRHREDVVVGLGVRDHRVCDEPLHVRDYFLGRLIDLYLHGVDAVVSLQDLATKALDCHGFLGVTEARVEPDQHLTRNVIVGHCRLGRRDDPGHVRRRRGQHQAVL